MRKDLSHCTFFLIRRQINAKKIFYVDYIFNLLIFKVNSIHLHNFVMRRLMIIYAQHLFRKFIYKEVNRKINFHWNPCFTRFWAYIEGEFIPIYFLFSILSTTNYKNGKFFTTCCFTSSNIGNRITRNWQIVKNMFWFCYLWGKLCAFTCWYVFPENLCTGFTNISS